MRDDTLTQTRQTPAAAVFVVGPQLRPADAEQVFCLKCGAQVWRMVNKRARAAWTCYEYFDQGGAQLYNCSDCGEPLGSNSVTVETLEARAQRLGAVVSDLPRLIDDDGLPADLAWMALRAVEAFLRVYERANKDRGAGATFADSTGGLE